MYSEKKNILQLCALLKAHGIRELVLCPGSRNAPIVHSLVNDPDYTCYSVTDERSAGYFAIGRILETHKPVAVCCTSGSAVLNLHPAVSEAYYRKLPLIVVTADRPQAWIGQMDGQTLPQPHVYNSLVKMSVNLPEVTTATDEWYCNRLINEALLESNHHGYGPVQINIPISEPLFRFTEESLPKARVIRRFDSVTDEVKQMISTAHRLMIIRGQEELDFAGCQLPMDVPGHAVVLSEQIGNYTVNDKKYISNFDAVIYAYPKEQRVELAPDVLITYGGHVVSKRLKELIRKNPPAQHIHVSRDGKVTDTYACQTIALEMDVQEFAEIIKGLHGINDAYTRLWRETSDLLLSKVYHFPYSEISAIGNVINHLPASAVLHLGNSSAVRYAQIFRIPENQCVFCNRGTSGIEGSVSTMVGYAAMSDKMNVFLIGDLSFFYDMDGLWSHYLKPNMRIMMLNNGGGEIFQSLPGLTMGGTTHAFVTASHHTSARGWAEQMSFEYYEVNDEKELDIATQKLLSVRTDRPIFVEVFTEKDSDVQILKEYYHTLKITTNNIDIK